MIDGLELEQVSQYKYLGTWITKDERCELDVKTRIAIAKDAFWKHKELLKGNISLRVKKRILQCYHYVYPVLKYSCESWTLNNDLIRRINSLEQWCYRRILKIKFLTKQYLKECKKSGSVQQYSKAEPSLCRPYITRIQRRQYTTDIGKET